MKKSISIFTLALLLFTGCQSAQPTVEDDGTYSVITSFYPLYFLTSEIVGDLGNVSVFNLIPSGGEPHSYEPSPSQLAKMESADLLIVQGAGLEPWFEGLEHELEHDGVSILEVNAHLDLMEFEEEHDDHEEEHDEHEEEDDHDHEEEHDDHDHGDHDPHTWLDPVLALEMMEHITEELVAMDPANEAVYTANAQNLTERLQTLNSNFEDELASCELDMFITSHDAFNYLAERYGFHAHSVSGVSPFDEPSASQLAELIELAEDEGVQHIFFEVLANAEAAEVLADEAGLSSLVLNPIAGLTTEQAGEDYITLMEENLNNLKLGLACD